MKKIILTILVALITFGGYYFLMRPPVVENPTTTTTTNLNNQDTDDNQTTTNQTVDYLGYVTIVVIDETETEVINDVIGYVSGDTLFSLLEDNYNVGCADSSYQLTDVCVPLGLGSRVLLQIDNVITNWTSSYLAIYIDDVYATKGLDLIEIEDGTVYKFVYKGT